MSDLTPFDIVALLFLVGWFIVGYYQGLTRRVFGIIGLVFSFLVAVQLRGPAGSYLADQWRSAPLEYGQMIAFAALFTALWATVSFGIQLFYRPVPLLTRYPALDELLGGVLGLLEGIFVLAIFLIITDPFYLNEAGRAAVPGEFTPLRSLHDLVTDSATAGYIRHTVVANVFAVLGGLFPQDIVNTFRSALAHGLPLA